MIRWVASCESTNALAWTFVDDPAFEGIGADLQTAGRGRAGRRWDSPSGLGLYFSAALTPKFPPSLGGGVPLMAAVAAAEACEALGAPIRLKWPNDLLIEDRKLGGILTEARIGREGWRAIIGLGLNLETPPGGYPPAIPGVALDARLERLPTPRHLAESWLARLHAWAARLADEGLPPLLEAWLRRGPPIGSLLTRGAQEGRFMGLDPEGGLRLDTGGEIVTIHAGDVDLVRWGPAR